MPQKYIDIMSQISQYLPFIGAVGAGSSSAPIIARISEAAITALVLAVIGYLLLIPELKQEIKTNSQVQNVLAEQYTRAQESTASNLREISATVRNLEIDNAVIKNNLTSMQSKIDNIDDIANTKVRSIEGRIDSLEKTYGKAK